MENKQVLIVDNDPSVSAVLKILLKEVLLLKPSQIYIATDKESAIQLTKGKSFSALFIDTQIIDSLSELDCSSARIVVMFSDENTISDWKKNNISDSDQYIYKKKPLSIRMIREVLIDLFKKSSVTPSLLKKGQADRSHIIGQSQALTKILDQADKLAHHEVSILIRGESGTGKEVIARYIHDQSLRADHPFVAVNCGALPEDIIESELFGHVEGAFTGAVRDKKGLFDSANGGTLFLDEIGELPFNLQSKLLRVIEEKKIRSVGSNEEKDIDIRIISATHRDIEDMIQASQFREDLFHRINVMDLYLPPLRERREDITELSSYFLDKYKKKYKKSDIEFSEEALEMMSSYHYPGNIRELENMIQRGVVISQGRFAQVEDLLQGTVLQKNIIPFSLPTASINLTELLFQLEQSIIDQALEKFSGNRTQAAEYLQITKRSLKHRIYKYKKIG